MVLPILAQVFPTLAVATIYCLWFRAHLELLQKHRILRQRVAYMLWCAASEAD